MGLKSVRPVSTKCRSTSAQSSRESHEILLGASTSTGMTWLISPHWTRMTAVPMPPDLRHRSSRLWMSAPTSGSLSVMYVRGTICVLLIENLQGRSVPIFEMSTQNVITEKASQMRKSDSLAQRGARFGGHWLASALAGALGIRPSQVA